MKRRQYIQLGAITTGMTALAGCSTSSAEAPPRKSQVIEDIDVEDETIAIEKPNRVWVASRLDVDDVSGTLGMSLSDLSPVGVASAKGRGRGVSSRGSSSSFRSAPKTSRGRARYAGGSYVPVWYNDHDDEVERYPVNISEIGLTYIGDNETFEQRNPGPGPLDWDETVEPNGEEFEIDVGTLQEGWYRVGAHVVVPTDGDNPIDMGWEAIDFRVEEEDGVNVVTKEWKVSPRI